MNIIKAEQQKKICKKIKNLVTKIEDNIKEETLAELAVEIAERPPAGIRRVRPNSAHHYWVGGLRTNGWNRNHNY